MDYEKEILKYLIRGYCCSEALVCVGLDILGEENDSLINASSGLCLGMHSKGVCGALTGGCLLLAMTDRSQAPEMCQEFYDWFEDRFATEYGSVNCSDILGTNPRNKMDRCKPLMGEVVTKCEEILEDYGLL